MVPKSHSLISAQNSAAKVELGLQALCFTFLFIAKIPPFNEARRLKFDIGSEGGIGVRFMSGLLT